MSDIAGKTRTIDPDHPLIQVAHKVGTCLGSDIA